MFGKESRIADDLKDLGIVDEFIIKRVVKYIRMKMLLILFLGMGLGVFGFIFFISILFGSKV